MKGGSKACHLNFRQHFVITMMAICIARHYILEKVVDISCTSTYQSPWIVSIPAYLCIIQKFSDIVS